MIPSIFSSGAGHCPVGKVDWSARLIRSFSRVFSIPARIARSRAPSIKFHMLFLNSSFTKWSSKILSKIKKKPYFNLLKFISGFYWTIKNDICKTFPSFVFQKEIFLTKFYRRKIWKYQNEGKKKFTMIFLIRSFFTFFRFLHFILG